MYDPTQVLLNTGRLWACRYCRTDYMWGAPLLERLNPLRIEIGFRTNPSGGPRWYINRKGRWQIKWSNFNWWLWKRRYRERRP